MKVKKCSKCGHENPMDNRFCAQCGQPFKNMVSGPGAEGIGSKKPWFLILLVIALAAVAVIFGMRLLGQPEANAQVNVPCAHVWSRATCTQPQICSLCGLESGRALGHQWQEASCTNPRICTVCGMESGAALGHQWQEASCTNPRICTVCGMESGGALGHQWLEATCTAPQTCAVCNVTTGNVRDHQWVEATNMAPRTCRICGLEEGQPLDNPAAEMLRERLPVICYALSSSRRIYGYEDASLSRINDAYSFDPNATEIVIIDVSSDGKALYVQFPTRSGFQMAWFAFGDIVTLDTMEIDYGRAYGKTNTNRYSYTDNKLLHYGSMENGSEYCILGMHASGYPVILYAINDQVVNDTYIGDKMALLSP